MTRKYFRLTGEKYLWDDVYSEEVLLYSWSYDKCATKAYMLGDEYLNLCIEEIPKCDLSYFNWLKKNNPVGDTPFDFSELYDSFMSDGEEF